MEDPTTREVQYRVRTLEKGIEAMQEDPVEPEDSFDQKFDICSDCGHERRFHAGQWCNARIVFSTSQRYTLHCKCNEFKE